MRQHEKLDSLLERFYKIVDREIRQLLRKGPTDLDAVCKAIEESSSMLLLKIEPALGKRHWRIIVQRRLKHTQIPPSKALAKAAAAARQPEFDFHNIEQFRGIPDSVTYEDQPGHVTYLHYLDTTKILRKISRDLLSTEIAADIKQLHAREASDQYADRLTEDYGGDENTPLRNILVRWFADDERQQA